MTARKGAAAYDIVDLFSGADGWGEGLRALGNRALGIEHDPTAASAAQAAGHDVVVADVGALDPLEFAPVSGLIASPPCQAYSMAGKGAGRRDIEHIIACSHELVAGTDSRKRHLKACEDPRSMLVVEPLRWALALRPRWIALEQVPPVLEMWTLHAQLLRDGAGYDTWAGLLRAEQYGVPQTRERAFLIASLDGPATPPAPTHQRYIPPRRRDEATDSLFDTPEPERIVAPEDRALRPWVSMAQALGWPAGLPLDHHRGAGMTERHGERTDRTTSQPAPVVTAGESRWSGGPRWTLRANDRANATERSEDEPAPTITAAKDYEDRRWLVNTGRDWKPGGGRDDAQTFDASEQPAPTVDGKGRWHVRTGNFSAVERDADGSRSAEGSVPYERPVDAPAPTVTGAAARWTHERSAPTVVTTRRSDEGIVVGRQLPEGEGRNVGGHGWTADRPATTVAGDPRVHPPGHKENSQDEPGRFEQRRGENAVRVTLEEAAVLQGFRPDYPFQGTKSQKFMQVGNAVPPPLARAVAGAAMAPTLALEQVA